MAASLTLLPAILAIVGRRGFWPSKRAVYDPAYVPEEAPEEGDSRWARLGRRGHAPAVFTIAAVVAVFLVGAIGLTQYKQEATVLGAFRNGDRGHRRLRHAEGQLPGGRARPGDGDRRPPGRRDHRGGHRGRPGGAAARCRTSARSPSRPAQSEDGQAAGLQRRLRGRPVQQRRRSTAPTRCATRSRRWSPELTGYVGGVSAIMADYRDGAQRDAQLVVPLVLLVVLLTLIALLRAIVAPLYLIGSVILSFFGMFGVCLVFFTQVLDETGFDPSLPIFAFIFLVALGVDYNIFLMDRVREEARRIGTRRGALRALVATGPVITSAGIILAGTFAVLAMLPIDILLELGTVVAFGVLVDTFIVRSMLVPAIITVVGDKSWWPSALARTAAPAEPARPRRDRRSRSRARMPRCVEQLARPDPLRHVLRLGAVDAAVLELDHGVLALAAEALEVVALARAQRALHELVLDALLVERLLHAPAGMRSELGPDVGTAMELDGHARIVAHAGCATRARIPEVLMHEGDRHAALADGGGDALDRAEPHVAAGEDAGHARLEQVRVAVERPAPAGAHVRAGEHVAVVVERDLGREPRRLRVRADEDVQPARLEPRRLARRASCGRRSPRARHRRATAATSAPNMRADVRPRRELVDEIARHALLERSRCGRGSSRCAHGWRRPAPPARRSCRRRRCGRRGRGCSAPRCARRRTRCPSRRAGRSRPSQSRRHATPQARMIVRARRTSPPSRCSCRVAASIRSIERVTRISAPSRRACWSARLASSSPDTPDGKPR